MSKFWGEKKKDGWNFVAREADGSEWVMLEEANERVAALMADLVPSPSDIVVNVKACQRCGENHDGMVFSKLANPADEYTHWGVCPQKHQPVLLGFTREVKAEVVVKPDWIPAKDTTFKLGGER